MADIGNPNTITEPGLFYFEGLAVQILPPAPPAGLDSNLDFSEAENSPFIPSTGPVV
jgi:hypothetical protein